MNNRQDGFIHFFAGACGGAVGAVVACPFEVIKTRLQSSNHPYMVPTFTNAQSFQNSLPISSSKTSLRKMCTTALKTPVMGQSTINKQRRTASLYHCFRHIIQTEGPQALYKGLVPTLIGVVPARAIYFLTYSQVKKAVADMPNIHKDSPIVHIAGAVTAGFTVSTVTNPIWLVKTRLQLDNGTSLKRGTLACIKHIYKGEGFAGFYRGLTASYYGVAETVIHLVIYEALKIKLRNMRTSDQQETMGRDFLDCMAAAGCSRTVATVLCYPHEVAGTRMREEGSRYRQFWQTLSLVMKEHSWRGLYSGLGTQLLKQIPNSAFLMATYELVAYLLTKNFTGADKFDELEIEN